MSSVIIELTPSSLKPKEYRILIPKKGRCLFPNYYKRIEIETDEIGELECTYNPTYCQLSIGKWLSLHPELGVGDRLIIKVIEPLKRYHLEILKGKGED